MSDMERFQGTLTPLDLPVEHDTWEKQIKYLQDNGHYFEDLDIEEERFYAKGSSAVKIDSIWYNIHKTIYDDDMCRATRNGDKIEFILNYYNGGCCFDEALEDAYFEMKGRINER